MRTRTRAAPRLRPPGGRLIWLAPLAAFLLVGMAAAVGQLDYIVGASLALVVVVLVVRRPELGLLGLIIFLPFQTVVFSLLFEWGISRQLVRQAGSWKDALAIGVVIAGIRGFRAAHKRLDLLDYLGLAFIVLTLLFAFFPQFLVSGASTASDVRSLGFRQSAGFVMLLLGARHAPLSPTFGAKATKAVLIVGTIVSAVAVYEFFFSDSWNTFVVETIRVPKYRYDVLNTGSPFITDLRYYGTIGGEQFTRVGSVLLSPLTLGFYLLIPFAFAIERTVREGLRSYAGAVLALTSAALIFSQTRAAIIGALIIALLAIRPAAGRTTRRRLEYGFIISILVFLALPVAAVSGLTERSSTAVSGDDASATSHWDAQVNGVRGIIEHPLGQGLGTSAGVGQRFSTSGAFVTEDYYLQVGIEMGVIGMLLFIALTCVLIKRLGWAIRRFADLALGAMRSAVIGLAVGAALLHTWNDFAVAWTAWALAGAVLGYAERGVADEAAALEAQEALELSESTAPIAAPP